MMLKPLPRTLLPQLWAGTKIKCSYDSCSRPINRGDECFGDCLSEANYCQQCGIMLRYHRKKANERGEEMPVTFNDIGKVGDKNV